MTSRSDGTVNETARAAGDQAPYPPIGDYALLSDCHSTALVSRVGNIDWCCMPRIDSPSIFGRLLDWERGGHCGIELLDDDTVERRLVSRRTYVGPSMVLETTLRRGDAEIAIVDALAMTTGGARHPRRQLLRSIECRKGPAKLAVELAFRFDYGAIRPWLRDARDDDDRTFTALGGSEGMLVWSDLGFRIEDRHDLRAEVVMGVGERRWISLEFCEPETIDSEAQIDHSVDVLESRLDETLEWWHDWVANRRGDTSLPDPMLRSALVLKSLVHAPTGAISAAPTTSLPESVGGVRNWDYRYSWVRDSWFTVRALAGIGFRAEADGFRRFVERSAAGNVDDLQLLYTVDGAHRTPELELPLEGYRGSRPVRIGNAAGRQVQLDMYGYLLQLAWEWHDRGQTHDAPYWRFITDVVDRLTDVWDRPDHGIWEIRDQPRQFVHSKVMCWSAFDRALDLVSDLDALDGSELDTPRWHVARDQVRELVLGRGVHPDHGCFLQSLDGDDVDAALLLIPATGFVAYDDPRMVATVDRVIEELDDGGLIRRYRNADGLSGHEGALVACTFWLVECLVALGRRDEAAAYHERACRTSNDLGLFAEEFDVTEGMALGNHPQALSHLAHIGAARALDGFEDHHELG